MRLQVNLGLMYVRTGLWDTFLKLNVKYAIRNCKEDISITYHERPHELIDLGPVIVFITDLKCIIKEYVSWKTIQCVEISGFYVTEILRETNFCHFSGSVDNISSKIWDIVLTFKLVVIWVHFPQPFLCNSTSRLVFVHSKQRFNHLHHFILGFMPHSCTSVNPRNGIGISVLKAVLIILQVKNGRVFGNVMACMISNSVEQQRLIWNT